METTRLATVIPPAIPPVVDIPGQLPTALTFTYPKFRSHRSSDEPLLFVREKRMKESSSRRP